MAAIKRSLLLIRIFFNYQSALGPVGSWHREELYLERKLGLSTVLALFRISSHTPNISFERLVETRLTFLHALKK